MTTLRTLSAAALAAGLSVATPVAAETPQDMEWRDAKTVSLSEISAEKCQAGAYGDALALNNLLASLGEPGMALQVIWNEKANEGRGAFLLPCITYGIDKASLVGQNPFASPLTR